LIVVNANTASVVGTFGERNITFGIKK